MTITAPTVRISGTCSPFCALTTDLPQTSLVDLVVQIKAKPRAGQQCWGAASKLWPTSPLSAIGFDAAIIDDELIHEFEQPLRTQQT